MIINDNDIFDKRRIIFNSSRNSLKLDLFILKHSVKRQKKREKVQATRKRFCSTFLLGRAREIELAFLVTLLCAPTNQLTAIDNREVR